MFSKLSYQYWSPIPETNFRKYENFAEFESCSKSLQKCLKYSNNQSFAKFSKQMLSVYKINPQEIAKLFQILPEFCKELECVVLDLLLQISAL